MSPWALNAAHAIWAAPRMPKRIASSFFSTFGGTNAVNNRITMAAILFAFLFGWKLREANNMNLIPR